MGMVRAVMPDVTEVDLAAAVRMVTVSGRAVIDTTGTLTLTDATAAEVREWLTPPSLLPVVARCECGMPAELDSDVCPTCKAKGARKVPAWKKRASPRPGEVKHRSPTAPPAPKGDRASATCPHPFKVGYRTERDALRFLAMGHIEDQWPYRCDCGQWHNATVKDRWRRSGSVRPGMRRWQVDMLAALRDDPDATIKRAAYKTDAEAG